MIWRTVNLNWRCVTRHWQKTLLLTENAFIDLKMASLTQIAQICAGWGQKYRVIPRDNPKSGEHNATKIRISTINLALSRGRMCHAGHKTIHTWRIFYIRSFWSCPIAHSTLGFTRNPSRALQQNYYTSANKPVRIHPYLWELTSLTFWLLMLQICVSQICAARAEKVLVVSWNR